MHEQKTLASSAVGMVNRCGYNGQELFVTLMGRTEQFEAYTLQ